MASKKRRLRKKAARSQNPKKTKLVKRTKPVKRTYKSTLFARIFRDKKELLKLYNAVSKKNYDNPEDLIINTLENAIYLSMKNDLSFIIDSRLSLYEHQSTYNPNMPLRFLFYLADLYSSLTKDANIYGRTRIPLPAPKFIVFYNGQDERPEQELLLLSSSYITQEEDISLELKVEVLNINYGYNKELMDTCRTLHDYSEYVRRVRLYAKDMPIDEAVERAVKECIKEDILREFLIQNRAEAIAVSIYEYDEEKHMKMEREESFQAGFKEGQAAERANTEEARARAEEAHARAEEAHARAEEACAREEEAHAKAEKERIRAEEAERKAKLLEERLRMYENRTS